MKSAKICENLYELSSRFVKLYLIEWKGELTLIDTAIPGKGEEILGTIEKLGFEPEDLKHILITHLHEDHAGSLDYLREKTGATVSIHRKEMEGLKSIPHLVSAPGLMNRIIFNLFIKGAVRENRKEYHVDVLLEGGETLDYAGGLRVIATPGHSPGHTSYLYPGDGGVLIVGDAASGGRKPGYPVLFSDEREAFKTLAAIGSMNFNKACFSHGKRIDSDGPARFREAFHRQVL